MRIRRLGWAGLEIESGGTTVVVDLVQDTEPLFTLRDSRAAFPGPMASGNVAAALVTHLHVDHTDAHALSIALRPGAPVFRPERGHGDEDDNVWTNQAEQALLENGLSTEVLANWEHRHVGPFRITAVPAVDGLGDPQVSWVVEAGGRRVFHGGDTLFHGSWWLIAKRCGPFDAAFLPINGAVVDLPHLQPPSPLPAAMDPRQAAVAAHVLGARKAVPIHYEYLHKPPRYIEVDNPIAEFRSHATEISYVMEVGEWLDLTESSRGCVH